MSETTTITPTITEMVADWLKAHGYDGLYDGEECACHLDDLCPCETHYRVDCHAAVVRPDIADEDYDYYKLGFPHGEFQPKPPKDERIEHLESEPGPGEEYETFLRAEEARSEKEASAAAEGESDE